MASVFEPSDWITLKANPRHDTPRDVPSVPNASAEVAVGSARWKLLEVTLKSLSVEPRGIPSPAVLQIRTGLKVVSWDQVTRTENFVIVTFDSSGGRKRQDQSLLTSLWLRPLRVVNFVAVGPAWDVDVKTCAVEKSSPDSPWNLDEIVTLKKVSGDVVVAQGWLLDAWEAVLEVQSPHDPSPTVQHRIFESSSSSSTGVSGLGVSGPSSLLPPFGVDGPDSKRLRPNEFNGGKYQAVDLDRRVWYVSESTGQSAILKVQFLIRSWPADLVYELLPGLKWSMVAFWEKVLGYANLLGRLTSVSVDVEGPQFHRYAELVQYPLLNEVNEPALEAFLLGEVFLLREHVVGLRSFAPNVLGTQSVWGEEFTLASRVKIADCVEGWSKFMMVFVASGLEAKMAVLSNDLRSFYSSCRFLSSYVIATEVWFLLVSFMGDIKTKPSVIVEGAELSLSSPMVLGVVMEDRIKAFLMKARTNPVDLQYTHYVNSVAPFKRTLVGVSPKKPDASPSVLSKKQLKKRAAEEKWRQEDKKKEEIEKVIPSVSSSAKPKSQVVCRFDAYRLLGLKNSDGVLFECNYDSCSHLHHKQLNQIPTAALQRIRDHVKTGNEAKEAITKYLLNSK